MNAIKLTNVTKSFGQSNILNELSLAIPEGSLYGLIGENGAGKTTTMKLLLGLLPPDSGSIQLFNQEVTFGNTVTNQYVGYLPDVPQFYEYMTAREYLSFCGELTHINKAELPSRITNMLQKVGLDDTSKKIGGYSRGMKQRLGLAQALLNEPKLIICDEPTSALDPTGRHEFLELLSSLKGKSTILFSSHILSDVEQICDSVAILHNGTIQLSGEIKKLTQAKSHRYVIQFNSEIDCSSFSKVMEQNGLTIKNDTKNTVTCSIDTIRSEQLILETLYKENILPNKLQRIEPSLEDVFLEVTTNEK